MIGGEPLSSGFDRHERHLQRRMCALKQLFMVLVNRGRAPGQGTGKILPLPDQGVTLPVTYDRNEIENQGRPTPRNRRLGYARVSTVGQTLDSQLEQLRAAGCTAKIYREKVTGAHNDRRELLKMLKHLAPGDVVTVTRIDRLARSTFDLFAIVKQIVDAKAQFRSLAEPWADTGTSTGGACAPGDRPDGCAGSTAPPAGRDQRQTGLAGRAEFGLALTAEREAMLEAKNLAAGPALLDDGEWQDLKRICDR